MSFQDKANSYLGDRGYTRGQDTFQRSFNNQGEANDSARILANLQQKRTGDNFEAYQLR
jgi:hypothetical protein